MAATHNPTTVPAPASEAAASTEHGTNGGLPQPSMPYTCQACAKRKIECDKLAPECSSCRKSKLACCYQAPPPPKRRRRTKLSDDAVDGWKLARYEKIMHQHGLLPKGPPGTPSTLAHSPREVGAIRSPCNEPETSRMGKLLVGQGKSRYIDSPLWKNLGDDAMQRMSDDEEEGRRVKK
ncbi:hypothetical protein LTR36_003259 [Oleoguttula mirabilis]|uniref:Zn(2)-C6 fungal-type domain-containing protein n=1 Tax=Oleoguttula mirabilis TaxID=1507867 RepID=A0AAV9JX10_9PEZI|nr:hypothetical protein LTR36_003259 [Oleoguttula mirabilis]